jgi:malonyl CoA-acyl carrier protein transacylase
LSELDRLPRFGSVHLKGENAAALIFTGSAADAAVLDPELDVVAVLGNSMGWYTALHVAGVLSFEDGLRLADTMGGYQADEGVIGGQVIVPVVGTDWRPDPALEHAVADVIESVRRAGPRVWPSIHLGGFEVIAGDLEAVHLLLQSLPRTRIGERDYPFQLLGHSAFHTPLMASTAARGRQDLSGLPWSAPKVSLVDGRGFHFRPHTTHPDALRTYTLDTQVQEPFDFAMSLRVVLREFAPDALVLLGPGDTLGGAIGQVLVRERWSGIVSKAAFVERQMSESPYLFAMARAEQRLRVARKA